MRSEIGGPRALWVTDRWSSAGSSRGSAKDGGALLCEPLLAILVTKAIVAQTTITIPPQLTSAQVHWMIAIR